MIGTVDAKGGWALYTGIEGVDDNDILIETEDISKFDVFQVASSAGAMDVDVHNGVIWVPAISMLDLGATTTVRAVVTAANRLYRFRGAYHKIRVRQNGATPVTGAGLRCALWRD